MSWAEEQSWFGLEDQALEALYGSDYDLDSTHLSVEFISIPAWRMKDGKLIAIRDMETSHIKNCIKMIYRSNGTWRHQYLRYFEAELRKRKYLKNQPIQYMWTKKYKVYDTTGAYLRTFDSWKAAYSFCLIMGRRDWRIQ